MLLVLESRHEYVRYDDNDTVYPSKSLSAEDGTGNDMTTSKMPSLNDVTEPC